MASVSQPLSSRDRPPRSASLEHEYPKASLGSTGSLAGAAASYLHLQLLLVALSVEQKAKGEELGWGMWLREGGTWAGPRPCQLAGLEQAPCNTHLLFFLPPQWNRWPGGERRD